MPRGTVTSATVVPTALDDDGGITRSLPSHRFSSGEEDGQRYSSSEGGNAAGPAPAVESNKYFQAAFNGKPPVTQAESNVYLQAAFNAQAPVASTPAPVNGSVGETLPPQQQTAPKSTQPGPIAPLIGKSMRQRSQSAIVEKKEGIKLAQNYAELVKDFKQLRQFTRRRDGKYPGDTRCVYCANARPTSVFFPCQHMCVCNDCIEQNNLSPDYSPSAEWCMCPVCAVDIRLILPHTGKEEEKYWRWVLEVKPSLPSHFKQEFKEAGKHLRKNSATESGHRRSSIIGAFFPKLASPAPDVEAVESATLPPGRRHSWQPGAKAIVQNVAASNEQEEAHNCTIL
ncbi:hypothetical protein BBJ28_00012529 [Nothophytophthora sp. Chile5]|nr:hypothetical protein BBJ28_00012529 [Nothophytophthora sp. Chile5]